jgi:hypothetical protein
LPKIEKTRRADGSLETRVGAHSVTTLSHNVSD